MPKAVLFLGVPFVTDEQKMIDWIESPEVPKNHEKFEKSFPGFIAVCRKAIKEVANPIGRLQYLKGIVQAFPRKDRPEGQPSVPFHYYIFD
jgi:hypothetical protein